jgi:hypothetical protein
MPLFCEPEQLASYTNIRVAVIIDEFQDMKFYVYNMSKELFSKLNSQERLNGQGPSISQPPMIDKPRAVKPPC